MFPTPATTRWSTSASPTRRDWSIMRSLRTTAAGCVLPPTRSGPSPATPLAPGWSPHAPNAPTPVHSKVTPDDDVALELDKTVLPDRLDALEETPVHGTSNARREAARVRARRDDALADEHPQRVRDALERVHFGHGRSVPEDGSQPARRSGTTSASAGGDQESRTSRAAAANSSAGSGRPRKWP